MKSLKKFRLLMWKHFLMRKYHWFVTLMEIFLPILIAYFLCHFKNEFIHANAEHKNVTIEPIKSTEDLYQEASHYSLVYCPNTDFTTGIMKSLPDFFSNVKIKAIDDEMQLELFLSKNDFTTNWIGIVFFNNSENDSNSKKLNYKIRDFRKWNTNLLFPVQDKEGPEKEDPYYVHGFAGIQLAIDSAYIKSETGSNYKEVKFQAFPYPEYIQENSLQSFVPLIVCFTVVVTLLMLSLPLIKIIIEEKETGVKELLKIVGLNEWLIWISWFVNAFLISFISFTIVTFLLIYDFDGNNTALIRYVQPSILWTCIMLYCIANIPFCFLFTAIFHNSAVASSIFFLTFGVISYLILQISTWNSILLTQLSCLFPVGAFIVGFQRMIFFEMHNFDLTWSSLFTIDKYSGSVSIGYVFLMLIFDTIFYALMTSYINAINPGKFGSKKSPFFIFKNFMKKFNSNITEQLITMESTKESKFFEKLPTNLDVSIQIKDLRKNFGSVYAVRDMNLNVYKGEITALLGHNGAGKTTALSILTGMMKPLSGSIIYKGHVDVFERMDEFRQNLGLCLQEDRLFPYLSVMNHLLFFGMLKGLSKKEASNQANKYLQLMEMKNQTKSLSKTLSGGMKRKLCLSIALMGKAEILILDEPTSGIDVESRRKIWDLLLELRGNRTIILTTHHMEEADVLADRIAIMNHGEIVCHGTPLFLKKSYETGYEITITTVKHDQSELMSTITNIFPNAEIERKSVNEIVCQLPFIDATKFPKLFQFLETRKQSLGIENIGVSCTTMEQVFLKVGGLSIYDSFDKSAENSSVTDGNLLSDYPETKKIGLSLAFLQLQALFRKKWLYTSRNLVNFFFRIVLPTLVSILLLRVTSLDESEGALDLSLKIYSNSKVMLQKPDSLLLDFNNLYANYIQKEGDEVIITDNSDVVQGLLQYSQSNLNAFRKEMLLAAAFNTSINLLLYNRIAIHSLPIAINTFSNVLLQSLGKTESHITAINYPAKIIRDDDCVGNDELIAQLFLWFFALAFWTVDLSYYFTTFLSIERIDGFKHIQFMSNVSSFIYWLGTFIFDFTFFFLVILLRMVVFKLLDDRYNFISFDSHLAILFLFITLFIISGLLFIYVVNYFSNSTGNSSTVFFILNISGVVFMLIFYFIQLSRITYNTTWLTIVFPVIKYIIFLVPVFNYPLIFLKFFIIWKKNNACSQCSPSFKEICEKNIKRVSYLEFSSESNPNGFLEELLFLCGDVLLYAVLLTVVQCGYFDKLLNNIMIFIYGRYETFDDSSHVDTDIQEEQEKIHSLVSESIKTRNNMVLLTYKLKKKFLRRFFPFTAVNNVTFGVKAGQCFGLLGVNGAGKSTTFKMLTAALLPTEGETMIMNKKLSTNKREYLSMAGYCAQTNCIIEQLTGREILTLIASLRGFSKNQVKHLVDKWISILGLIEYENKQCGGYSGGNKRKLCTAMSLIGDPIVVFLDEPTTGVDPISKRKLYHVMEQSKITGQTVVLTSHSMEECEKLCDRLTIMTKGNMKCIGTVQHLKQRYAQGFSILIKITDTVDSDEVTVVKNAMIQTFNSQYCVLKDEHRGLLYYQITNTSLQWSRLFQTMENIKNEHKIVEDYTITDTTLEEVFISFAKQE